MVSGCVSKECLPSLSFRFYTDLMIRVIRKLSLFTGVSSLRMLLAREKDEDSPKLNILLAETLVGVYMSMLIHAMAMYEANILYRLVAHPFHEKMWPAIFGGGIKKMIQVTTSTENQGSKLLIQQHKICLILDQYQLTAVEISHSTASHCIFKKD